METNSGIERVQIAWRWCTQHGKLVLQLSAIDLLGLVLFGTTYAWIMQRLADVLITINGLAGDAANALPESANLTQFMALYSTMLKLSLLAVLIALALWVTFFGYGYWRVLGSMRKHTPPLTQFLGHFALVNGGAVLLVFLMGWAYAQVAAQAMANGMPGIAQTALSAAFSMVSIAVLYLTFCAYQALGVPLAELLKRTLHHATQWRSQLFPFATLLLIACAMWLLMIKSASVLWLGILLVILLTPLATFARAVVATE